MQKEKTAMQEIRNKHLVLTPSVHYQLKLFSVAKKIDLNESVKILLENFKKIGGERL